MDAEPARLREAGYLKQAEELFRKARQRDPASLATRCALGGVLADQGKSEEARECFREVLEMQPQSGAAHCGLGRVAWNLGQHVEALEHFFEAVSLEPANDNYRRWLARSLRNVGFQDDQGRIPLMLSLMTPGINPQNLVRAGLSLLRVDDEFARLLGHAESDETDTILSDYRSGKLDGILDNPLFLTLLSETCLTDLAFEKLLAALRRCILAEPEHHSGENDPLAFLCALALQGSHTQYLLPWEDEDQEALARIEKRLDSGREVSELELALLAAYRPLEADLFTSAKNPWSERFEVFLQRTVRAREKEKHIAKELEPRTPITDPVSRRVRAHYEENPYPQWSGVTRLPPQPLPAWLGPILPGFDVPEALLGRTLQVLVAGCGTGAEAVYVATALRDSDVLAIDLSAGSLAYGIRMAGELGVENVSFEQADLLELDALEKDFDVIFCSGVLHHLGQPSAGLRELAAALRSPGLMRLALYSRRGRRHVRNARSRIEREGYQPTADGVRRARQHLLETLEADAIDSLTSMTDFFYLNGCRDLFFRVQEHHFDLYELGRMLDDNGLRFVGFDLTLAPEVRKKYVGRFPGDLQMVDLARWDAVEEAWPDSFAHMYQFWCLKTGQKAGRV